MISVIKTTSGGYNVIGTDDGVFILQGHLTEAQLRDLKREITKALKK
jgi:hypothetical protein